MLALAAGLIWCAHHGKWTLADWNLPTDYQGDAHEILARIKAAAEGDTWPLTPQVIERLKGYRIDPLPGTTVELSSLIGRELPQYFKLAADTGLKLD